MAMNKEIIMGVEFLVHTLLNNDGDEYHRYTITKGIVYRLVNPTTGFGPWTDAPSGDSYDDPACYLERKSGIYFAPTRESLYAWADVARKEDRYGTYEVRKYDLYGRITGYIFSHRGNDEFPDEVIVELERNRDYKYEVVDTITIAA